MPAHPKPSQRLKLKPTDEPVAKGQKAADDAAHAADVAAPILKLAKREKPATSKSDLIAQMLVKGATSKELEAATGWQPHSVRGLLGTWRKKGVNVISTKVQGQPTVYRIETEVL